MILEVIKDQFIDIVIGKDILKKHNKVIMKFNGPGDELICGELQIITTSHT